MRRKLIDGLFKLISDWAIDQKVSEGSYAPVDPKEIVALNEIILKLLELKYQRDPDGDLPVEWTLVDRTHFYHPFLFYSRMKYPHNARNDEGKYDIAKLEEGLDVRLMNLSIAMDEVKMISRYITEAKRQDKL